MPKNQLYECTLDTCPITDSIYHYRPSLGANIAFLVLFAITGIGHVVQGVLSRKKAFWITMLIGCISEVIGYVGRVLSWQNPFASVGFLTQIVCLTIAPAFYSAAVYFCLGDIVRAFPPEISRITASGYAKIFIPCDVVSLILQGTGGGMASVASQNNGDPTVGTNIMVAGLSFQVASLFLFIILASEYAFRLRKWRSSHGATAHLPVSRRSVQLFLAFFPLAILCIFIRCVYRVAELSDGWSGKLIHEEGTFIGLEGVMVLFAVYALHNGHPGVLLRGQTKATSSAESPTEAEKSKP